MNNKSLLEFYLDDIDNVEEENLNESQSQEIGDYYRKFFDLYGVDLDELVYGEDGFMKSCYPNGFPDFAGDVIYSEKYWNEFEKWLKDTKGIELHEELTEAKKKKKPYDSKSITTGNIAYNLSKFNQRMGTAFPGNDNNNPSTEEAKAAAQAANDAVADGASEGTSGDASGASAGGEGGAAGSCSESLKEDIEYNKENQFVFTPEEQEEYNCDEEGNSNDSYDQYVHCGWCGEVYTTSDCREEATFGYICPRCQDELHYHGGELMFIESKENLTEAKRYVRRYFIRPQQIFCSNKSEILKSLIDLGNENCSVYTLNNLGDIKDVTKLTNDDIIYYYDDGILYDKNHVKVMDYDLSIKHEEDRKKFSGKPTESDLKSDEYDDRMTKVTVVEDVDWTDSLLDEYYDSGEAIESGQKLYGTDNAVVKCKKYDVVAHCEDEKPVDCNLEKKPLEKPLTEEKNNKDKYTVAYVEVEDPEHPDFYAANGLKKHYACKGFATAKAVANRLWNKLNSKKPTAAVFVLPPNGEFNTDSVWAKGCNGKVLDKINANGKNFAESLQEAKEEVFVELTDEDFLDEALTEAKKDEDDLPADPEVVKLNTHNTLNTLVADEIESIDGYEEAKAEILDAPIEHKDAIIDTLDHIKDEEKEHIDELINATAEIPFGKDTAAPVIEKPATEEKASEEEFVDITDEDLNEALMISDDAEWADVDSYFYITDGKAELKKEHIVAIDALKEIYNFIIKHPKSYDNIRLEWMEVDEDNNEVGPIASIYDKAEMLEHNINIKVKSDWDRAKNVIYCAFKVAAPNNANIKYDVYGKDLNEGVEEINKKPGDATIAKLKDKYPTAITITGDKLNDEFINTLNKDSILIIDEAEKIKHGQGYKTKLNDLGCKVFIINYKNKKLIDEGMLSESDQTLPYDHDHIARPLTDEDFEKEGYEISIGYYEEHDRGSRYISYNEELYADSEVVVSKGYDNKYHLWTVEWGEDGGGGWEGETNETFDTLEELNDALSKIKFDWIDYEPLNPYKFYKSKQTEALEENEFDLTFESYNAYGEKLTEAQDKFTCCICGEESYGYGNNPAPVKEEGRCCDSCNAKFVIPARLEQLRNRKNEELDK